MGPLRLSTLSQQNAGLFIWSLETNYGTVTSLETVYFCPTFIPHQRFVRSINSLKKDFQTDSLISHTVRRKRQCFDTQIATSIKWYERQVCRMTDQSEMAANNTYFWNGGHKINYYSGWRCRGKCWKVFSRSGWLRILRGMLPLVRKVS